MGQKIQSLTGGAWLQIQKIALVTRKDPSRHKSVGWVDKMVQDLKFSTSFGWKNISMVILLAKFKYQCYTIVACSIEHPCYLSGKNRIIKCLSRFNLPILFIVFTQWKRVLFSSVSVLANQSSIRTLDYESWSSESYRL